MFIDVFNYAGKLESDLNELHKEILRLKKINDYLYKAHKMKEDMIKRTLEENRILTNKVIKLERIQRRETKSLGGAEKIGERYGSMRSVRLGDARIKLSKGTVLMDMVHSQRTHNKLPSVKEGISGMSGSRKTGRLRPEAKPNVPYQEAIKKLSNIGSFLKGIAKSGRKTAQKKSFILGN